jgi:hypothetical protein
MATAQARIVCGFIVALVSGSFTMQSAAQSTPIPKQLTGRWTTPESRDGQSLIVELDRASSSGTLSLSFADQRCTIRSAPMTLAMLGDRITLKLAQGLGNPCVSDMTLELVPNRNSKGEDGYLGELRLTGSAANRAPILRGRLTPP